MSVYVVTVYTKGGSKITEEINAVSSYQAMQIAKSRYPKDYSVSSAQRLPS